MIKLLKSLKVGRLCAAGLQKNIIMKYIVYLFFRYHSSVTHKIIAYHRSIVSVIFLIYINFTSLALFLEPIALRKLLLKEKVFVCFILILLFVLGYFLFKKYISKEYFDSIKPSKKVKFHGWLLFLFVLFSMFFMFISLMKLGNILHLGNVPN